MIDGLDHQGRRLELRPVDPAPRPCKVCGGASLLFGVCDFSRPCLNKLVPPRPPVGLPLYYRRCQVCGLLFTEAFDDWSTEDFRRFIYNDAYGEVDPEYRTVRPETDARMAAKVFEASAGELDVLDYGGGGGVLAERLRAAGFRSADTYDPFNPAFAARPDRRYRLITCLETLEHMPDPAAGAADMLEFLADDGMIFFSTLVQPPTIEAMGMNWWYIGPRNGHVTLFTLQALNILWKRLGLTFITFNTRVHAAYRTPPSFAQHLMPKPA